MEDVELENRSNMSEEKPKNNKNDGVIDLKISQKGLLISSIIILLLLAGLLIWQTGVYKTIYAKIMPATIEVTVIDKDTTKPIANSEIRIGDIVANTNTDGVATITGLSVKEVKVSATSKGYISDEKSLKLKRDKNTLSFALAIYIEKTTLTAKVTDAITNLAVPDAQITIGEKNATTDSNGQFTIADLPTGETTFSLAKEGYNTNETKNTVLKDQPLEFTLVPSGKVYFISNRENGKRGIYRCDYDGSNVTRLIKAVEDTEDYDLRISPDRTKITFLSTRDKRKDDDNSYIPDLFVINADGTGLAKINSAYSTYGMSWTKDSKYLVWTDRLVKNEYVTYNNIYNVKTAKSERINSNGSASNFMLSHDGTYISWYQNQIDGNPISEEGLYFRKISGGDAVKIYANGGSYPSFSNDDKFIQYNYYNQEAKKSVYMQYNIANGETSEYTPEINENLGKALSPDGKNYAYTSTRDGKTDVYISNLDGKNERKLTNLGTVTGFDWELDSQFIILDSSKTAETAKYIVSTITSTAKKVTDAYVDTYQGMQ
ncbi:MAG: carboxypeptidase regulatory-like domain-containing protein [bacterium]